MEAAEGETKTLEQTILFVEANRARFRHIDDVSATGIQEALVCLIQV